MRAWLFQDHRQKRKLGDKTRWSVGWIDPEGKRRSKRIGSKSVAEKFRRKKEGELAAGLCSTEPKRITWGEFREEYERTIMPKWRSATSVREARRAFTLFAELISPKYVSRIDDHSLDRYVALRLRMPGKKRGDTLSPETVRKELRTIRAALGVASRWKYLPTVPTMPNVEGFGRDKPFVTEEHFDAMLTNCAVASMPRDQHYAAGGFWRALLATAWVTGMRKGALLALRWDDVDLESGIVLSRYGDNKPKNDQRHHIGPAVGLLRRLYALRTPGDSRVFPWNYSLPSLDRTLASIQKAAGIHLLCRENHEHTDACHLYGFHSFRYAHATYNYGRVSNDDLQEQMGHASFQTTKRYIKYAETHRQRAYDMHVPESLKTASG